MKEKSSREEDHVAQMGDVSHVANSPILRPPTHFLLEHPSTRRSSSSSAEESASASTLSSSTSVMPPQLSAPMPIVWHTSGFPTRPSTIASLMHSKEEESKISMEQSAAPDAKDESNAVVVSMTQGHKSFGKGRSEKKVLENMNMRVNKGVIYGLLGASGCGKTTVLSCLVGRRKLESGRLRVFGGLPGNRATGIPGNRVGYMPQELALYLEFTIAETLVYFGRIYSMSSSRIRDRMGFLLHLLDLPHKDKRPVATLSGGQKRRVSFAVALLHDPELLILDEPTVGVDPMLRQSIWTHLLALVNEQEKTVLITTHYIEEARQASVVGLMRNGRLLAEAPPRQLLEEYDMNTLEDVFLKLCIRDTSVCRMEEDTYDTFTSNRIRKSIVYPGAIAVLEENGIKPLSYVAKKDDENNNNNAKRSFSIKRAFSQRLMGSGRGARRQRTPPICQVTRPSVWRIWALLTKNLIKMWRNLPQLLFIFLLPPLQVVFFCVAIGRDPSLLPLSVVNDEHPMSAWTSSACSIPEGCDFGNLSCRFLYHVFNVSDTESDTEQPLVPLFFTDLEEAELSVRSGSSWGVLHVKQNFSDSLLVRLYSSLEVTKSVVEASSIEVALDASNQQVSFAVMNALRKGYEDFFQKLLLSCDIQPELADLPLVFTQPIFGDLENNFTHFLAPGIIILIIFFLALALTGELFLLEKRDGLLDRCWIAGVLPSEIITAHIATQFVVLVGQSAITLVCILLVFNIPCKGPVAALVGLTLLQGLAGMCYGIFLSALMDNQSTVMQASIGSFYPMLLLSGILWPVEGMPYYLRRLAWWLPCTAACQAMRDVMARGWGLSKASVALGYLSTSAWIAIFVTLSWIVVKIRSQ